VNSQKHAISLSPHVLHEVEVTTYGLDHGAQNLAVECLDCQEVIGSADLTGKPTYAEVYKALRDVLEQMAFDYLPARECPDCSEVDGKCTECQLTEAGV